MLKSAIAKFLTVKAAGVALAVTVAGGAAVAATGVATADTGGHPPKKPAAASSPSHHAKRNGKTTLHGVWGLCHAYLAQADHGAKGAHKADSPRPFAALVKAAGGAQNVVPDCTKLLAGPHPTAKPHRTPAPKGKTKAHGHTPAAKPTHR